MSVTSVSEHTKVRLWGKAAGRCQYSGCNRPLWRDDVTKAEHNSAYVAHIIADKSTGPRGDAVLSDKLKDDITNLMLLCDVHHRLVDKTELHLHPVDRLKAMKEAHEGRVEIAAGISPDKASHIVLYGPNIGEHSSVLAYSAAAQAMIPLTYPAKSEAIRLDMIDASLKDRDPKFWTVEEKSLVKKFTERVQPGLAGGAIRHVSIFARAPQPLLVRLGALLTDISLADVYQLHREPQGWTWPAKPVVQPFRLDKPSSVTGPPALVLSLSATITADRITRVLKPCTLWTISVENPNQDCIQSPEQLRDFRKLMRGVLDQVKVMHGQKAMLHIFPAVPVSVAVELGRVRQPKADVAWSIYDQNNTLGGFVPSLKIA